MNSNAKMVTIRQVAQMGIMPEATLRRMVKRNQIPGFYSGKRFLVNVSALNEMLNSPESVSQLSDKSNVNEDEKCESCAHHEACNALLKRLGFDRKTDGNKASTGCKSYVERSKVVELPCKIGDAMWWCLHADCIEGGEKPGVGQDITAEKLVWDGNKWSVLIDGWEAVIGSEDACLSKKEAEKYLSEEDRRLMCE